MTAPVYEAFLYQDSTRLSELEFTRLEVASRFLRPGRWEATVPELPHAVTWKTRLKVVRNGVTVFTGPLTQIQRKWTYGEVNTRILVGTCDLKYIQNGIVLPPHNPSTYPPWFDEEYDIRTGVAETVIRNYIDYNIGPTAEPSYRRQGIFLENDGGRGDEVNGRGRFQNLLEFADDLAIQGHIGFQMIDKTLKFYVPQNLAGTITFSQDIDNLKEFEYEARAPEFNAIVLAGQGEGIQRFFLPVNDEENIEASGRVETYYDGGDAGYHYEMYTLALAQLTKAAAGDLNLHIIPGAQAVENMKPYEDYFLGDTVTALIDGERIDAIVQEVGLLVTRDDVHEHATLGSFGSYSGSTKVADLLRALSVRTRNLEAST